MIRTVLLLLFAMTLLLLAVRSLRAQRLKERYVLLLLFVAAPFLVLALWPDGIVWASRTLNIEKPTMMVLALAAFLILIIFELLSIVSVQDRKIAALAQVIGLLTERQGISGRRTGSLTGHLEPPADADHDAERRTDPAALPGPGR